MVPKNSDFEGKSGGGVRMEEILSRIRNAEILLVTTDKSKADILRRRGGDVEVIEIRSNLKFKSLLGLCVKSLLIIAKTFFVLKLDFLESKDREVIAYASSDLFWEVLPAFYFKTRKKSVEWVQVIHHIYPDWKKRPGSRAINFFGFYLQKFSFFLIKKKADKIIVLNNLIKNELVKYGFGEKKLYLSYNGIDLDYLNSIEKKDFSYDGVFLGRLSRSKGTNDLIEIWKRVCESFPDARLAIVGGGSKEEKKQLLEKIGEYDLEKNIDLLGFLENTEAFSILKSGKVSLFPSHEEGWGIAISEAMACALPVVAWNLPVYKEIFENRITQIKENDSDLFSSKVLELLKNDAMRKKFGEDGKEFIKKYSWDEVAKKELEIICVKMNHREN